jgi:hypothetical protein
VPPDGRLVLGNELLATIDKTYPKEQNYHVKEHSLRRVTAIVGLKIIKPPIGWIPSPEISTSLDVFVGYLMLDAWIGNQDRHHENWGLVVNSPSSIHLAPTFDHNSSLGWNETDESRRERLRTLDKRRSVEWYAKRARSAFFTLDPIQKPLLTFDAFVEALKLRPIAGNAWLKRLEGISEGMLENTLSQVPPDRITRDGLDFALEILRVNQRRLLTLKV